MDGPWRRHGASLRRLCKRGSAQFRKLTRRSPVRPFERTWRIGHDHSIRRRKTPSRSPYYRRLRQHPLGRRMVQALQYLRRDLPEGQPPPDSRRHHRSHRLHPLRPVRALLPGSRHRGSTQARRERQAASIDAGRGGAVRPYEVDSNDDAAYTGRGPGSGSGRQRPTSRHHRRGERFQSRPRQPDLIGQDT